MVHVVYASTVAEMLGFANLPEVAKDTVQLGYHTAKTHLLQQLLGVGWGSTGNLLRQLRTVSPAFSAMAILHQHQVLNF